MDNILLAITGSVAAIKYKELYEELSKIGNVKVIMTAAAENIIKKSDIPDIPYLTDGNEKNWEFNDILHIELRNWATCLVIAPLSMNTLGKIANGLCDNLVTEVVRAWNNYKKIIIAPAANTEMWNNAVTIENLTKLKKYYNVINVGVDIGKLACGDFGPGKMKSTKVIVDQVKAALKFKCPVYSNNGYNFWTSVPVNNHPGSFGYKRKGYYHPGVDLYCQDKSPVYAVEDAELIFTNKFTGPPEHPHWEKTHALVYKGAHIINYGELYTYEEAFFRKEPRKYISAGDIIGKVKRVIPLDKARPDIPGHSCSMLHFEMYKDWDGKFAEWINEKPKNLLDPTKKLIEAYGYALDMDGKHLVEEE